jgi:predicted TIM-barrel enzyme
MIEFVLTGIKSGATGRTIYCPCLSGLTDRQADLSMVLPRIDNNKALLTDTNSTPDIAGVLTCDPFGNMQNKFLDLKEAGYKGIANWPSSILFEGQTRQTMASIPARPTLEYDVLKMAENAGLETLAFFMSLEQGRAALKMGLRTLILHPGPPQKVAAGRADMISSSLQRMIDTLKDNSKTARILVYTPHSREKKLQLNTLHSDGLVTYAAED